MSDPHKEKILSLFYSDENANDLLALEIIKHSEDDIEEFIPALITIVLTSKDKDHASLFYKYLKKVLTPPQTEYLKQSLEYESIRLYPPHLQKHFGETLTVGIFYFQFKRTGYGLSDFLTLDQGEHPNRKEVFTALLAEVDELRNTQQIKIPGLLAQELEAYIEKIYATSSHSSFYSLSIDSPKTNQLPENLFSKTFRRADVNFKYAKPFFPDFIFKLHDLERLSLAIDSDSELPKNWAGLANLEQLIFNGKNHIFQNLDFLNTLPKLKSLYLRNHILSTPALLISKKKLPISDYINFDSVEGYTTDSKEPTFALPQEEALKIGTALGKSILSNEEKEHFLKKIIKHIKLTHLETLTLGDLVTLMNVNHAGLRNVLNEQIDTLSERHKGSNTLNDKALLYICGTPSRKKTEIKQQLKELNIPLATKASEPISHLVICKGAKDYKELQSLDVKLVSEQALYQLFKKEAPGFLEEAEQSGDTDLAQNVLQFLYSDESSNITIGLEMLKTGGVPTPLIDPLLIVYKTCPDTKVRGIAKKLLDRHAPAELFPLINDSQRFTNLNTRVKAQEINKKLEKIAQNSSRQLAAKLALLFHQRFKKGLRYILYHFHEPSAERTLAFQAMMEGTHFDFSAGLGFTNNKDKNPEEVMLFKMATGAKFPIDAIDNIPLIESANFHNCKYNTLPATIGEFKDLKELDISHNFLKTLPKSFEQLTKLESLNLQMNNFKRFPKVLTKLKKLKHLDLRHNRIDHEVTPVDIPEDVRKALKNCEILE